MSQPLDNLIEDKVEEILSSPSYQSLDNKKREELQLKIEEHLKILILESFVNRLNERQSQKIINLLENNPEEAYKKIREFSVKNEALVEDLEPRINREVEKFKSLKS